VNPPYADRYWRVPVQAPVALLSSAALPRRFVWLAALMLFFLAAANGRPLWWSSAIPSVIVAVILLLERGPLRTLDASFSRYNKPIPLFFC
jgi:hypothetical protein